MNNEPIDQYFEGFEYPGHEVKAYSKANNHFQILLRGEEGKMTAFEPPIEQADRFNEWLLRHKAVDVKARDIKLP